jgi:hypothetical protein
VDAETISVPVADAEILEARVQVRIDAEALYTAEEAAVILGMKGTPRSRQNAMYEIPEDALPRFRVGPNGGRLRWLGRDLLNYRREHR